MRTLLALFTGGLLAACTSPAPSAPDAGARSGASRPVLDELSAAPDEPRATEPTSTADGRATPRPTLDLPPGAPFAQSWSVGYGGGSQCCSYATDMAVAEDGRIAAAFLYRTTPARADLYVYTPGGRPMWSMEQRGAAVASLAFAPGGDVIVADSPGGHGNSHLRVRAVAAGGRVRWTHRSIADGDHWTRASAVAVAADGDVVIAGVYRRHGDRPRLLVERLDRRGHLRWSTRARPSATSPSVAVDARGVYLGGGNGRPWVHALTPEGEARWHVDLPVEQQLATAILVDDSDVFVTSRGYGYRAEDVSFLHRVGTRGEHRSSTPVPAPPGLPVAVHAAAFGEGGALLLTGAVHRSDRPGHDIFMAAMTRDGSAVRWWDRLGEDGRVAEHGVRLAPVPSGGLALLATAELDDDFHGLLRRWVPREVSPEPDPPETETDTDTASDTRARAPSGRATWRGARLR